jgi:hypothetical protein
MRRTFGVLGIAAASALALAGLTGAARASANTVTITVVGISRTGARVTVQSTVVPLSGNAYPSSGPTYQVVPGTYFIGASVPTLGAGRALASQTLVLRRIRVTDSATIALDARGGRLVSVWLNGRDLGGPGQAAACARGGIGVVYPSPPAAQLYVQPTSAAGISFGWTSADYAPGAAYDLAGDSNGLPADPVYRWRTSQLDRTIIAVKAGPVPDTTATWHTMPALTTPALTCSSLLPAGTGSGPLPLRAVVYRTPGGWQTEVDTSNGPATYVCSTTWASRDYLFGRQYTDTFDSAVHGPSEAVPVLVGRLLSFDAGVAYQFTDPVNPGYEYCNSVTVALSTGGRTVATERFTGYGGPVKAFSATVKSGRWYVLAVSSRQSAPDKGMPAGLLSPQTTLTWRFKVEQGAVPVAEIAFLPLGLDMANQAKPGSLSYVRAWPTQNAYVYRSGSASAARTFRVQVSYTDGKTWSTVRAVWHGSYWLFAVHDPKSGFVTLRSTALNAAGDSSVETIYRAYGVG